MQALGLFGLRLDHCTVDLQALDVALLYKNKEEGGRQGLRSWALRCLISFFLEIKYGLLRGRMCCV